MHLLDKIKNGVYTIAEMSANHGGDLNNALSIVRAAKESGADCLKIQTYTADTLTLDCNNEYFQIDNGTIWDGRTLYDLYKEAYMPWEWQKTIKSECEKLNIDFLSTPFDNTAVDYLEELGCEAYKIASFELVDIPLIKYVASKGKPMIMSCGMASINEIQDAVDACYSMGNHQIVLLKCCSEYPANYADMHVANIEDMRNRFKLPVGLSDHSTGYLADVVAVVCGARVIEKHFCVSRSIKTPDSSFSMEPAEWKEMLSEINNALQIKGDVSYKLSESEQKSLKFRRSIFACADIKKGEVFSTHNIKIIRPSNGVSPKCYDELIGKKAIRNIDRGNPIVLSDLENGKES